jgi:hypothetical protein
MQSIKRPEFARQWYNRAAYRAMAHDAFISYASKDKPTADATCALLEARGIRCWIAPRDVEPGSPYGNAIIDAIRGCRIMVVVLSSQANESNHIPKEVERAVSIGATIIPLRIEDVVPGSSLDYFIGSVHWLDALTPPLEKHLETLAATIRKILPGKKGADGLGPVITSALPEPIPPKARTTPSATLNRPWLLLGVGAVLLLFVVLAVKYRWLRPPPSFPVPTPAPSSTVGKSSEPRAKDAETPHSPGSSSSQADNAPRFGLPARNEKQQLPSTVWGNLLAIAGCWNWENGKSESNRVEIRMDGTIVLPDSPFHPRPPASWETLTGRERTYQITWPGNSTEIVTTSADRKHLSRVELQHVSVVATRISDVPCAATH